jgi:hypothetical protein
VSEWLLLNANSAIFQLYHGENKVNFHWDDDEARFVLEICVCCFSSKHAVLMRKSKDWFARNRDNVSEWNVSVRSNWSCWSSTKRASSSSQWKLTLFSPWYSWKIAELALSNNHSLTCYRANQSLLFLINTACLEEKQQTQI